MIYFIFHKDAIPLPVFTLNKQLGGKRDTLQFLKALLKRKKEKKKTHTHRAAKSKLFSDYDREYFRYLKTLAECNGYRRGGGGGGWEGARAFFFLPARASQRVFSVGICSQIHDIESVYVFARCARELEK